jgi:hypothetical protein
MDKFKNVLFQNAKQNDKNANAEKKRIPKLGISIHYNMQQPTILF